MKPGDPKSVFPRGEVRGRGPRKRSSGELRARIEELRMPRAKADPAPITPPKDPEPQEMAKSAARLSELLNQVARSWADVEGAERRRDELLSEIHSLNLASGSPAELAKRNERSLRMVDNEERQSKSSPSLEAVGRR